MTEAAQSWLPIGIASREVVRSAIGRAVADWSTLWFPRSHISVSAFSPTPDDALDDPDGAGWKVYCQTVAVSCAPRATSQLAGWALDAELSRMTLKTADRRLLDRFERTLIEDLAQRVEQALGVEGAAQATPRPVRRPFDRLGGVVITLAEDFGTPLLSLAIPLAAVVAMCRSSMPPARRPPAALASFARALGAADLTIEASLGQAEVPVSDLRALAPGDVLVLQRGLTDTVDVSLAGCETAFARARLIDLDGQMGLALQT